MKGFKYVIKHRLKIFLKTNVFIAYLRFQIFLRCDFMEMFKKYIGPKLSQPNHIANPIRDRYLTLYTCLDELQNAKDVLIVETGAMRADHGLLAWGDDGCSTLIFNLFALRYGGVCISVDNSKFSVTHATKFCYGKSKVIKSDSLTFLSSYNFISKVDLLYLDSYDFDPNSSNLSQEHHLREIQSCFSKLKSGCLVLIDDADTLGDGSMFGKATLVIDFFAQFGIQPIARGYQVLFRIP